MRNSWLEKGAERRTREWHDITYINGSLVCGGPCWMKMGAIAMPIAQWRLRATGRLHSLKQPRRLPASSNAPVSTTAMIIDKYLPKFQFREEHALEVAASPSQALESALNYQLADDPFFRSMIALRELPARIMDFISGTQSAPVQPFSMKNFTLLEVSEEREAVFGLAGRSGKRNMGRPPWRARAISKPSVSRAPPSGLSTSLWRACQTARRD